MSRLLGEVRAVFFDLFDTLVEVDESRLPSMTFRGKEVRATTPVVHDELRKLLPDLAFDDFVEAYGAITRDFWDEKEQRDVEMSAPVRMGRVLAHFRIADEDGTIARRLAEVHMSTFVEAVRPIDGAHEVLERVLRAGHATTLISNFDFAPAARAILERLDLARFFPRPIISDEMGLRKPNPRLFEIALEHHGIEPRAALHVGDDARADAWGAARVGLRTVWIDRRGEDYPEDDHPPDLRVRRIDELLALLEDG